MRARAIEGSRRRGSGIATATTALLVSALLHASSPAPAQDPAATAPASPREPVSAEEELARARNLFSYGDYEHAAETLAELVLPGRLAKEQDLVDAHRMLGIAFYQVGKKGEARREFMALLYLAPDTRLDPFLTPPPVVEFFDEIRASIADKLAAVREQKERERAAGRPTPTVTVVERRVRPHQWAGNFVPFGFPQFDRGEWVWGLLFLTTQATGAVSALGLYWGLDAIIDSDGFVGASDRALYDALRIAHWSATAFSLAAYGAGVGEAILSYQPETLEVEEVREVPVDELPAAARANGKE